MTKFGLDKFSADPPKPLAGKRVGIVCHAASVDSSYRHVIDVLADGSDSSRKPLLSAIFGPQHGLFGQTQDNMVEWEGSLHPALKIPVYSLYGEHRKPTPGMLDGLDALIFDVQDVGARPYTYVWTLKHCMEACAESGIPVWVFDRPNPIGKIDVDGPMLSESFFFIRGRGGHTAMPPYDDGGDGAPHQKVIRKQRRRQRRVDGRLAARLALE